MIVNSLEHWYLAYLEYFNMMLLPNNLHFASVEHFDVMETIAEGIMTQIVKAKDKKTGDLVAIRKSKLTGFWLSMHWYKMDNCDSKQDLITLFSVSLEMTFSLYSLIALFLSFIPRI
jgi:hypothetical protein